MELRHEAIIIISIVGGLSVHTRLTCNFRYTPLWAINIVGFNSVKLEQLSGEPGCIGLNERHLMST